MEDYVWLLLPGRSCHEPGTWPLGITPIRVGFVHTAVYQLQHSTKWWASVESNHLIPHVSDRYHWGPRSHSSPSLLFGGPGRNQTDLSKGANLARPLGTCGPRIEFVVSQRPPSFRRILPVLTSPGRLEVRGSSSYLTVAVLPDSNRCLKRFSKPLFHCIHAHNKTWLFR